MRLSEAHLIEPGHWVHVVGEDFDMLGRLTSVEYDSGDVYVETQALCDVEPTVSRYAGTPTVRITLSQWESPWMALYSDVTIEECGHETK